MITEKFWGAVRRENLDSDLPVMAHRLFSTVVTLARIAPKTLPPTWNDVGWYTKQNGRVALESIDFSQENEAVKVCERMVGAGNEFTHNPMVQLESLSSPRILLTAQVGTGAQGVLSLDLGPGYDESVDEDLELIVFSNEQRINILKSMVDVWGFTHMNHRIVESGKLSPQVQRPPLIDLEARRQAVGVRWTAMLGWITYFDLTYYPIDIGDVEWPDGVSAEVYRTGVLIKIGASPLHVSPGMIARVRKAIGLAYVESDLTRD